MSPKKLKELETRKCVHLIDAARKRNDKWIKNNEDRILAERLKDLTRE